MHAHIQIHSQSAPHRTMCNITFCEVDSKVDQFFQPTLYIIVIILGLPTNCMALWAAYMQVRTHTHTHIYTFFPLKQWPGTDSYHNHLEPSVTMNSLTELSKNNFHFCLACLHFDRGGSHIIFLSAACYILTMHRGDRALGTFSHTASNISRCSHRKQFALAAAGRTLINIHSSEFTNSYFFKHKRH